MKSVIWLRAEALVRLRKWIEEEKIMSANSVEHASFTIERVFKATPEQVFRAFADPAAHDRWFVKADGWPVAEYSHDFQIGRASCRERV